MGTVCKNKQARADSDYEHGYGDRNETITLTREVERVGVVPGPSGVCATRCSTFSSPISKKNIFKKKSVADMLGVFWGWRVPIVFAYTLQNNYN